MRTIDDGDATICLLCDTSLARVEKSGHIEFFGSDDWKKVRVPHGKPKWAAIYQFKYGSFDEAMAAMRSLDEELQKGRSSSSQEPLTNPSA